jgi:hypothetical protein
MDNDNKNTGFVFWTNKHTWADLTDSWKVYEEEYLYFRMNNDNKN